MGVVECEKEVPGVIGGLERQLQRAADRCKDVAMVSLYSRVRHAALPIACLLFTANGQADIAPAASAVVSVKQPTANAAFARGPDYAFAADTKSKVKRAPVSQLHAYGATVAPDGVTFLIDSPRNGKNGGLLVSKKNPRGAFYATPEVHDVVFSPGSKYVAVLDDETRQVAVLSVPEGKVIKQFSRAYLARFRSDTLFQYRTDCQLYEVDLTGDLAARQVGPKLCGGADASMDGSVWIVAQPSTHGRVLSLRDFSSLTHIDGATGKTFTVPAGNSLHDPSVSPGGKRICYGNSGRLSCYNLETKTVDALGALDAARLDWEQNDQLMLGASRSEIVAVNFTDRTTRKLSGLEGIRYWRFFPGGTRVYVYQNGATLLDLAAGTSIAIFGKKVEVGGFVPVPGRMDRFMTGNEVGSSRVHYWIDVVAPKPTPDAKAKLTAAPTSKTPPAAAKADSKQNLATTTATATSTKTQGTASATTANLKTQSTQSSTTASTKTKAPASATAANVKTQGTQSSTTTNTKTKAPASATAIGTKMK